MLSKKEFNKIKEFILDNVDLDNPYYNNRNFSKRRVWELNFCPRLTNIVYNIYHEHDEIFNVSFSTFIKYYFFNSEDECYGSVENFLSRYDKRSLIVGSKKYDAFYNKAKHLFNFEPKNFQEMVFAFRNGITNRPNCEFCKCSDVQFQDKFHGYRKFCSQSCQLKQNNSIKEILTSNQTDEEIRNILRGISLDFRNLTNESVANVFGNILRYSNHISDLSDSQRIDFFLRELRYQDICCNHCNKRKHFISQGRGYQKTCGRSTCKQIHIHGDEYYNEFSVNYRINRGGGEFDSGFLYIASSESLGFYKIGISRDPIKRLNVLRSNISDLVFDTCVFLKSNLFKVEQKLHRMFKGKNIRFEEPFDGSTEFFSLNNDDIKLIKRELNEN